MSGDRNSQRRLTRLDIVALAALPFVLLAGCLFLRWFVLSYDYRRDPTNQRSIIMSMIDYAKEHEGRFPDKDDGVPFATSTEAYQYLLELGELKEEYFYTRRNPEKSQWPNEDGTLTVHENCMVYVTGQNDSMSIDSPLTADEMEEPGIYGKRHPWLKRRYAVIGYVGGHAKASKLSQKAPGATVLGPPDSGITDIFQPRPTGLLSVPRENILLP